MSRRSIPGGFQDEESHTAYSTDYYNGQSVESHGDEISPPSSPEMPQDPRFRILQDADTGGLLVVPYSRGGKGEEEEGESRSPSPRPKEWPPASLPSPEIPIHIAKKLIAHGAPRFRGKIVEVPNERGSYHHYCLAGDEWDEETDCVPFEDEAFEAMSSADKPMTSLDRPYMQDTFGIYPGTITLSSFAASFGSASHGGLPLNGGRVKIRKLDMNYVISRLRTLKEVGIDQDDQIKLYDELYRNLIYDGIVNERDPHRFELSRQIADLIDVLSRSHWIDFSQTENQVVPEFFFRDDNAGNNLFFHQLVLSLELHLRILCPSPLNAAPGVVPAMAVKVQYDLVLAQRWLENVEIERPMPSRSKSQSTVTFKFQNKARQIETLRNFGWTLKWPNMPEVEFILSEVDKKEKTLEDRSVNCMSWFTGLILPGKTMPWVLMNSLIDCDPDAPSALKGLSHLAPNAGLQWRGSTYWSWESIVGKVLGAAKGVKEMCGWLGPLPTSPELHRTEVILVNQLTPPGRMTPSDVQHMDANSEAVPENEDIVHVDDFDLVLPDFEDLTDTIRLERMNFQSASANLQTKMKMLPPGSSQTPSRPASSVGGRSVSGRSSSSRSISGNTSSVKKPKLPSLFDASITFAIGARSWRVYLRHDTPFIAAYPCTNGPHPLYNVYDFRTVRPDKLTEIKYWGSSVEQNDSDDSNDVYYNNEVEKVLVIEAFGVLDNAVFSRAWCSYWGLSAIVADVDKTCMACCIREAYAASVKVVILSCERMNHDNVVEEVDRNVLEV